MGKVKRSTKKKKKGSKRKKYVVPDSTEPTSGEVGGENGAPDLVPLEPEAKAFKGAFMSKKTTKRQKATSKKKRFVSRLKGKRGARQGTPLPALGVVAVVAAGDEVPAQPAQASDDVTEGGGAFASLADALEEGLAQSETKREVVKAPSQRSAKQAGLVEISHLGRVLSHPAFQADPLAALRAHLNNTHQTQVEQEQAQVALTASKRKSKSKKGKRVVVKRVASKGGGGTKKKTKKKKKRKTVSSGDQEMSTGADVSAPPSISPAVTMDTDTTPSVPTPLAAKKGTGGVSKSKKRRTRKKLIVARKKK